jgi:GNAT superfamily N-acetyltransferase
VTTRTLPREEWGRLGETAIPSVLPFVRPDDIEVVVVEHADRIVGAWSVIRIVHLEGVWIAPEYRGKGTVAGRLLKATLDVARRWAGQWVLTGSDSEHVRQLIEKHLGGVRIPMDVYAVSLEGK